jgi:hypothetical protein
MKVGLFAGLVVHISNERETSIACWKDLSIHPISSHIQGIRLTCRSLGRPVVERIVCRFWLVLLVLLAVGDDVLIGNKKVSML